MANTEFKYDVFISYSSANKDWARKDLLSALEKAGLKVCIDFRDFKVGKPALKNMRDGILESRHTLLVLTEAYLKSGWTEFESLISQTLDPANSYALSGQPRRAVPLFETQNDLQEKAGDKENLASGQENVGQIAQLPLGALREAERNLRRSITLFHEINENYLEGTSHTVLGQALCYPGRWVNVEEELNIGLELFQKENQIQGQSVLWSYRALRFLLMAKETVISNQTPVNSVKSAIESAQHALELADEDARTVSPVPRDYVRAYWLFGTAYRMNNELTLAEENLSKALNLCRQINMVDHEANILLDLTRLRYASQKSTGTSQDDLKDALAKASVALVITERSGYVLQGADVHLFLAELAMNGHRRRPELVEGSKVEGQLSDKEAAIFHAKEALRLATYDGGKYTYK